MPSTGVHRGNNPGLSIQYDSTIRGKDNATAKFGGDQQLQRADVVYPMCIGEATTIRENVCKSLRRLQNTSTVTNRHGYEWWMTAARRLLWPAKSIA